MNVEIRRDPMAYKAYLDGERVGRLTYSRHGDVVTALHTTVSEDAEGQGVGGELARTLLDDARAEGKRVDAQCPFVAGWIKRHEEYADLLIG
jgi:uncharacterized protein